MRRDMSQVDTSMDTSRWAWPSWLKAAAHTQFWRSVLQAHWWSYCPLQISVTAGLRSQTPHAYSAPGFSCHRGLLQPVSDTSQPAPGHLSWWSGPSRGLSMTAPRREPLGHLSGTWAKLAEVVSPRRWWTPAWSPSVGPHMLLWLWHMRLSAGPSWVLHGKTKHTSWCWATFGEPSLPQQHPLPICEDKISGGTLWTLWV